MKSASLERNGSEIFDEVSPPPDKADPIAKPASQSSLFRQTNDCSKYKVVF
jgi:hypothetical protein